MKRWIENYIYYGKIYWDEDIACKQAKGRWNIISRLQKFEKGDILFLPKTSKEMIDDYNHFTLCQVAEEYYFDYLEDLVDFGHCIKVQNLRSFKYGNDTLLRGDFGTPYLWAITEVHDLHKKYKKFRSFIELKYLK